MFKNILQFLQNSLKLGQAQTQSCGHTMTGESVVLNHAEPTDTGISYSAQLIATLTHDHSHLLELYATIDGFIQQQHYAAITTALEELKSKFNLHIMQENLHFYCYLEQYFQDQHAQLDRIKSYRKEMNAIAAAVVRFIKKWQDRSIDLANVAEFSQEYQAVGKMLAQRIDQEENHLYMLYQP